MLDVYLTNSDFLSLPQTVAVNAQTISAPKRYVLLHKHVKQQSLQAIF